MNYKPLVSKSYKRVIAKNITKNEEQLLLCSPFLMKISVKQFNNRTFKRHLFLNNPRYLAVGTHDIDACGQVRYIDTLGIGGLGYFRAVYVVYAYAVYRFVGSYIQYIFDGVRVDGE